MAKRLSVILIAAALLLYTLAALAQTTLPANYVLGVDDELDIIVTNHPDLNKATVVSPGGTIAMPEIGEIKAAGLTASQLRANIQTELEKTLNNVTVSVSVRAIHPPKHTVRVIGGAIKNSVGIVEIKPNERIIDLIASTGGLIPKSSLVNGRLLRGNKQIVMDISSAYAHPEGPANILLEPDDVVFLDEIEVPHPKVKIEGQVIQQGIFDLTKNMTVASLLTLAGGPTPKAALNHSYIMRDNQRIPVDLTGPAAGADLPATSPAATLQPDDVVVVAENMNQYKVMGEVRQGGTFMYPSAGKVTVLEAFTQSGTGTPQSDLRKAEIVRFSPDNKITHTPVDLAKLMDKKSQATAPDPDLQPGDILWVPAKHSHGGLDFNSFLGPLSALSILFRL